MSIFGLATTNDLNNLRKELTGPPVAPSVTPSTTPVTPAVTPPPVQPAPQPTPAPTPAPVTTPVAQFQKLYGVNMAGAEFAAGPNGENQKGDLPGVEGTQYIYQRDAKAYQNFTDSDLKLFRIPFRWERMQVGLYDWTNHKSIPGTGLSNQAVYGVMDMLNAVQKAGGVAILDCHNYGHYSGVEIKDDPAAIAPSLFADFWNQVAAKFKNHPALYGFELMNEPQGLSIGADGWKDVCQMAITAIRSVDTEHFILIPGYDWQSAERWANSNPNIHTLTDSANKLIFAAHEYFDGDASGSYNGNPQPTDMNIGVNRVKPFLDWLHTHNLKGMITEYGAPDGWEQVIQNFLAALDADPNVVGGTYWAAGPWWGSYPLSLEPNKDGSQKPMEKLVANFKTK